MIRLRAVSKIVLVLLIFVLACKAESPADEPAQEKAPTSVEGEEQGPADEPVVPAEPEEEEAQTPCGRMFDLLRSCDKGNPVFRDRRFRHTFLRQCGREAGRPTAYAKAFVECTASPGCEELQKCSQELEKKAAELGPEHVDYMLRNNQRHDALKFCDDHRDKLKGNEAFEKRCGPLIETFDKEKESHKHGPGCKH
jgi:hypothetical protein